MPETPGRKGHRGQVRLQVARQLVDDQTPDTGVADRLQLRGDELVMPAQREWGPRVELTETARSSALYSPGLYVSAVVIPRARLLRVLCPSTMGSAIETAPLRRPGTTVAHVAAQPRDKLLDHLLVGRAERGIFSAAAGSALLSMSRSMSISILVAGRSAEAGLLTS